MQTKAQSAMEYLMTYGWAILIIAIVLATLFELGIFNGTNTNVTTCLAKPGFACGTPSYNASAMTFTIGQSSGHTYYNAHVFVASESEPLNSYGVPLNFSNAELIGGGTLESDQEVPVTIPYTEYPSSQIQQNPVSGTQFNGYVWLGYCTTPGCTGTTAAEKVATILVSATPASGEQFISGPGPQTLAVPNPSTSNNVVSWGNSTVISDSGASGGTSPYRYQWWATTATGSIFSADEGNTLCGSTAQSVSCTFTAPNSISGTYELLLNATDSANSVKASNPISIDVYAPGTTPPTTTTTTSIITSSTTTISGPGTTSTTTVIVFSVPTPTPASQATDLSQQYSISDTGAVGGTGPYTYQWFVLTPGSSTFAVATSQCGNPYSIHCVYTTTSSTPTGTYQFKLQATDTSDNNVANSSTVDVHIMPTCLSSAGYAGGGSCTDVVFNSGTTLSGAVEALGNVTIDSGIVINPNSYSIIAGKNFSNSGIIDMGIWQGGGGPYYCCGTNGGSSPGPNSYGGSGGGGGYSTQDSGAASGGATSAAGGLPGQNYPNSNPSGRASNSNYDGQEGSYTALSPTTVNNNIYGWGTGGTGLQQYLAGAGGGGSDWTCCTNGAGGGGARYGIYIQANAFTNVGKIYANGTIGGNFTQSGGCTNGGGGGGGGGSVVILAYYQGTTLPSTSEVNVSGGRGGTNGGGSVSGGPCYVGGDGGSGQIVSDPWASPPLNP